MKLHYIILVIFAVLLLLAALTRSQSDFSFFASMLVPVFIVWQVVIVLRDKEPGGEPPEFGERWYENP